MRCCWQIAEKRHLTLGLAAKRPVAYYIFGNAPFSRVQDQRQGLATAPEQFAAEVAFCAEYVGWRRVEGQPAMHRLGTLRIRIVAGM